VDAARGDREGFANLNRLLWRGLYRLRKNMIFGVILSEAKNLSSLYVQRTMSNAQRDFCGAQNDEKYFFRRLFNM
jgi:hypothetical protein